MIAIVFRQEEVPFYTTSFLIDALGEVAQYPSLPEVHILHRWILSNEDTWENIVHVEIISDLFYFREIIYVAVSTAIPDMLHCTSQKSNAT